MNITLGPGTFYIGDKPIAAVREVEELEPPQEGPKDNTFIRISRAFDELSFSCRMASDAWAHLFGVVKMVFDECPDRRVVHLAKHAKKRRTRKKNLHRAFKIMEV